MAIARTVDRRLFFVLDRVHTRLAQQAETLLSKGSNVSRSQALVLVFLGYNDNCRMSDLADGTGRNNAAVSGLVERMEKAGLVERRPSYGDRRVKTVALTPQGWAKREDVMNDVRDFNAQLVKGLNEKEVETVLKFLRLAAENVS
ncbi:MarR family transcriptional regulator [Litorimonas taeanensis]|uniref:MarR family transcriptional regulator n=1 Tax=Litorimonas taeanensis TaxID=568099 RepID=A0A420WEC6_9PROT|nr:MarR family winged helix-turn-helix transcriptional regulator [Litorimonas taeanensis]RKQ69285.1 MarR family transcriptional regulator [Litorimonas taeanensis]